MASPTNRHEFKKTCLRRLGWPDIDINLSDEAIDDRIDEALGYFLDFYYDGVEKQYYSYAITAQDIANKYIVLPDNVVGATGIFDLGSMYGTGDIFNITYQIALNDLWNLTNFNITPYYMAMEHIAMLQELLVGKKPIRYNCLSNKFYLDTDWNQFVPGYYIVIECFTVLDPDQNPKIWSDRWLSRYATALIQRNWATALSKYTGFPMPGGMTLNGDKMLAQSIAEIKELEDELFNTYQSPPTMMIGLWIFITFGVTQLMDKMSWLTNIIA